MSTKAVFTMKLDPELHDAFKAAAASDDRPAAQVVRELMRGYIDKQHREQGYHDFLRRKVERARATMRAGEGISQEEVEADSRKREAELLRQADEAGL